MEKLEKILHAEKQARARMNAAHDEAVSLVRDAQARAAEVKTEAAVAASAVADARVSAVVETAREEVARLRDRAAADLEVVLAEAESRFDRAVSVVLGELVD